MHVLIFDKNTMFVDVYIPRVKWLPDGSLACQIQNREQTSLDMVRLDPKTGKKSLLLNESSKIWLNLHNMWKCFTKDGDISGEFYMLWGSERSGFMHLYLYKVRPGHDEGKKIYILYMYI